MHAHVHVDSCRVICWQALVQESSRVDIDVVVDLDTLYKMYMHVERCAGRR